MADTADLISIDDFICHWAHERPDRVVLSAVLEAPDGGLVLLGEDGALRSAKP